MINTFIHKNKVNKNIKVQKCLKVKNNKNNAKLKFYRVLELLYNRVIMMLRASSSR